jgi:hypothetical protein
MARPLALIDWDFAAPAPREWDIAYALWRCVPLYSSAEFGGPHTQARRIRLFCDVCHLLSRKRDRLRLPPTASDTRHI